MNITIPYFSEQFCIDIMNDVDANHNLEMVYLNGDLELYEGNDRLNFIKLKQIEIRKKLEESQYKKWFSYSSMREELFRCLEHYFKQNELSDAIGIELNQSIKFGEYEYDSVNRKIIIHPNSLHQEAFNFSKLDYFKPLVKLLVSGGIYRALKHILEDEIKQETKEKQGLNESGCKTDAYNERCTSDISNTIIPIKIPSIPKKYLLMFKESGYELFCYLKTEYISDDKSPKAKYSNIYRFLKYENIITCTQLEYIGFVCWNTEIKMSKILPENNKYSETVLPRLGRLKCDFEKEGKMK